jgi:hypothetical protein
MSLLMALRDIPLRGRIWSLSEHFKHRAVFGGQRSAAIDPTASQQNLWAPSRDTSKPNGYISLDRKAAFVANRIDNLCRRGGDVFQRLRRVLVAERMEGAAQPNSSTT